MNTPQQQAELYRKAAETIEMCAKHWIEPKVKMCGLLMLVSDSSLQSQFECYEFPISVIEGQLVWADTIVYNKYGVEVLGKNMAATFMPYTLISPKQPLCEVEGKPVYKDDILYLSDGFSIIVKDCIKYNGGFVIYSNIGSYYDHQCSWNPPKRTVMVELLVKDAETMADAASERLAESYTYDRIGLACRKALDNLK